MCNKQSVGVDPNRVELRRPACQRTHHLPLLGTCSGTLFDNEAAGFGAVLGAAACLGNVFFCGVFAATPFALIAHVKAQQGEQRKWQDSNQYGMNQPPSL
jgi:hypothetical protein